MQRQGLRLRWSPVMPSAKASPPDAATKALSVQTVVWPWRSATLAVQQPPVRGAVVRAAVPLLVAGLLWQSGRPLAAGMVAGLGSAVLALALLRPAWHARFEHALQRLGLAVGTGVTWLLLFPVWWLCFVPGRLAFALAGKDPLQRQLLPKAQSYWLTRQAPTSQDHWKRQF